MFPDLEFRYWDQYTDAEGDRVDLDVHMRAHARVEDHIRRLKASGLERLPFSDLEAKQAWLVVVCFAADVVRWFELLCLAGLPTPRPHHLQPHELATTATTCFSASFRRMEPVEPGPITLAPRPSRGRGRSRPVGPAPGRHSRVSPGRVNDRG